MKVKNRFLTLQYRNNIIFWELYLLSKNIIHISSLLPLINITFHIALIDDKVAKWNEAVAKIAFVQLDDQMRFD